MAQASLLRIERIQVAPKLIEAASIGVGIVDDQFGRRCGLAPVRSLLAGRLDDPFDRRADRLDTSVDDGLDAGRRQHRAKRRPAERNHEPNPERDLEEAPRGRRVDETLLVAGGAFSAAASSAPGEKLRSKNGLDRRAPGDCCCCAFAPSTCAPTVSLALSAFTIRFGAAIAAPTGGLDPSTDFRFVDGIRMTLG